MAWFEGVELAEKDLPVLCGEKGVIASGENVAKTLRQIGGGI